MTLVYKCVLDIHKIHPHTEYIFSGSRHSKFRPWTARHAERLFWSRGDLDLERMTFIYESDVDILKMYLHTENILSRSRLSKVGTLQTDRQTHR